MSITEPYEPNRYSGKTYTLLEAVEHMKLIDKNYPTDPDKNIVWVNAKTGKRVSIGYNP